jgi:ribosomal protein S12 methylthiotransferase accessory factor YcaO
VCGGGVDMDQNEKFTKFNVAVSNITKLNLNPINVWSSVVYRKNVTTPITCSCKQGRGKSPGMAD